MHFFTRPLSLTACVMVCAFILGSESSIQAKIPAAAASAGSISFQYTQSLIYIKVKINKRAGLIFLLNTGANTTVIDNKVANELKLPVLSIDTVIGTAGKEPVQLLKISTLQIGNNVVKDFKTTKRDLSKFSNQNQVKIDGILGTDFLKKFAINIDFKTRKITFYTTYPKGSKQLSMSFDMEKSIPKLEARFNDTFNTYLCYNSGVSLSQSTDVYVNVSPGQWNSLKGIDRALSPIRYMTGTGVGGDVHLAVVSIKTLELNGFMIKFLYIIVQPQEGYFEDEKAIGFFGNNLLEKYSNVTIDFINSKIIFNTIKKNRQSFHN